MNDDEWSTFGKIWMATGRSRTRWYMLANTKQHRENRRAIIKKFLNDQYLALHDYNAMNAMDDAVRRQNAGPQIRNCTGYYPRRQCQDYNDEWNKFGSIWLATGNNKETWLMMQNTKKEREDRKDIQRTFLDNLYLALQDDHPRNKLLKNNAESIDSDADS